MEVPERGKPETIVTVLGSDRLRLSSLVILVTASSPSSQSIIKEAWVRLSPTPVGIDDPHEVIQLMEANAIQFLSRHVVIKVHQAIAVPGQDTEQFGFLWLQDPLISRLRGDLLVGAHAEAKGLGQNVPSQVKQGFQRPPQTGFGRPNIPTIREESLAIIQWKRPYLIEHTRSAITRREA
jgi:hypothetical protein